MRQSWLWALHTAPIPHSPPLFEHLLPQTETIAHAIRQLRRVRGRHQSSPEFAAVSAMSHEPKVVIARDAFPDVHLEQEHARGRAIVELASVATPGELGDATRFAHGLIVTNQPLSKAHFRKLGKGDEGHRPSRIGLDAIDLQAAREHGIAVLNLPNYATAEVGNTCGGIDAFAPPAPLVL